jgi:hypothetical protein
MSGLASEVSRALKKRGYTAGQVRDRQSGDPTATTIRFGAGAETDAHSLATLLGLDAPKQPDPSLQPGHILVAVDTSFSMPSVDETSTTDETTTTTTTKTNRYGYDATSTYPTPDQGKPIGGGGVPCVN